MHRIEQLYLNRLNALWMDTSLPPERKFSGMVFIIEIATYTLGPEKIADIAKKADLPFTEEDYYSIVDGNLIDNFESYQPIILYIERIVNSDESAVTERLDILSFAASILLDLVPVEDVYYIMVESGVELFYKKNIDIFNVYPHSGTIPKILTPIKIEFKDK